MTYVHTYVGIRVEEKYRRPGQKYVSFVLHTPGTGSRRRRLPRHPRRSKSRRNPDGKLVVGTWSSFARPHSVNRVEGDAEHLAPPRGARGTHPASGPAKKKSRSSRCSL